jgi:hypothetical protein
MVTVCPEAYLYYWEKEKRSMLHRSVKLFLKYKVNATDSLRIYHTTQGVIVTLSWAAYVGYTVLQKRTPKLFLPVVQKNGPFFFRHNI